MADDSRVNVIEVNLPLALTERLRALGSQRGCPAAALVEESLEAYFGGSPERPGAVV